MSTARVRFLHCGKLPFIRTAATLAIMTIIVHCPTKNPFLLGLILSLTPLRFTTGDCWGDEFAPLKSSGRSREGGKNWGGVGGAGQVSL
jgi:hypothetical protein